MTSAAIYRLQIPVQVLLYAGLFVFTQYLVSWLCLPLPADLIGIVLILALVVCRVIPLNWIRVDARRLLAEMLLFFAPTMVAVVNYTQLLLVDGQRTFTMITISTLIVLGATAWVVGKVYRYEMRRLSRE